MKIISNQVLVSAILCVLAITVGPKAIANARDCNNDTSHTVYYRSLAEVMSLAEPLKGVTVVSDDQAKSVAHYRITTDGCGAVSEINYFQSDKWKPIDDNYTSNRFVPSSQISLQHEGDKIVIRFYDHTSDPQTVFQNVASIVIKLDSSGRFARAEFHDLNDTLTDSSFGYAYAEWRWEDNGTAIESRFNTNKELISGGGDFRFSSARLTFDKQGFVSAIEPSGDNVMVQVKRYKNGSRKSWRIVNQDNTLRGDSAVAAAGVAGADYQYDTNGYLKRTVYLDINETPTLSRWGHMGFRRSYSEVGNRLNYLFIDEKGEVWAPPERGYAGQLFHWSDDGLVRTRTEYVDARLELINHPQRNYATIIYEFDESKRVTNRTFLDTDGQVVNAQSP